MNTSTLACSASAIDAVAREFTLLASGPKALHLDVTGVDGLPDGPVSLARLRKLLLRPDVSTPIRDVVWRRLIVAARTGHGQWTTAVVGMAVPGLKLAAHRLAGRYRGEAADIDSEMVTGFVAKLATVDINHTRLCARLIRAGAAAARTLIRDDEKITTTRTEIIFSQPPHAPYDHVDLVLARAVAVGVLTDAEADVIGRTRLEDVSVTTIAVEEGVCESTAISRRRRSEYRLRDAVEEGALRVGATPAPGVRHRQALFPRIVDDILAKIKSGGLRPGDRLASAREISEGYGVSCVTAQRALSELQAIGLTFGMAGKGTFVRPDALTRLAAQARTVMAGAVNARPASADSTIQEGVDSGDVHSLVWSTAAVRVTSGAVSAAVRSPRRVVRPLLGPLVRDRGLPERIWGVPDAAPTDGAAPGCRSGGDRPTGRGHTKPRHVEGSSAPRTVATASASPTRSMSPHRGGAGGDLS